MVISPSGRNLISHCSIHTKRRCWMMALKAWEGFYVHRPCFTTRHPLLRGREVRRRVPEEAGYDRKRARRQALQGVRGQGDVFCKKRTFRSIDFFPFQQVETAVKSEWKGENILPLQLKTLKFFCVPSPFLLQTCRGDVQLPHGGQAGDAVRGGQGDKFFCLPWFPSFSLLW